MKRMSEFSYVKYVGLSVITFGLFAMVGCQSPDDATVEEDASKPKVALIMKSLANEFFVNMADAARDHQKEHQATYDLVINGIKNESDLAQQVALVEQMIALGVDAIVIAPADSKALVPVLARAKEIGIHVVNIDNRLDQEVLAEYKLTIPFIGPNNRSAAKAAASHALEQYPAGVNVVILEGVTSAQNAIERRMGFEDAVEATGAKLVTMQSALWDQTKAADVTAAILIADPEVEVILAANDNMALGAASAIALAEPDHEIKIVGFDNISAVSPLLKDGRILATVEQYGDQFAVNGIELALEMVEGLAESVDRETPTKVITAEDLKPQEESPATQ